MANTDLPHGFRPWGHVYPASPYSHNSDQSTPLYPGDLVNLQDGDGYVEVAAAGEIILGGNRDFLTGSVAGDLMVYDHPDQKFVGQDDGTSATSALTHINNNCDHVQGTGSLVTKISAHEVDIDTATTVTAGLRLLDILNRADVEMTTFTEWIVRINEHEFGTPAGA